MNPETPHPETLGRTPAAAARAAVILALLGCGAVAALVRFLTREGSPLGDAFPRKVPPAVLLGAGCAVVIVVAAYGFVRAVRSAERYRITGEGWEVNGPFLGRYVLEWGNIARAEVLPGGLGISVRDREAVLRTHAGPERQKELLRTMQPFGNADFLYPQADLGHPPETVLAWIGPYLDRSSE